MVFNLKGTNIELTDAISQYVDKKLKTLNENFQNIIRMSVEVGLTSKRHQNGTIYRAEVNVSIPGKMLRAEHTDSDLYRAIDHIQYEIKRELKSAKEKQIKLRRKVVKV